ncbi:MAG TPA: DUF1501 domain-containing protein [Pirellulales bacterium]|jgi:hypothetical protein
MLYIRGTSSDARRAWSRRDVLRVGLAAGAGLAGGLPLAHDAAFAAPVGGGAASFGRAKSLVLVYLFGGPSHIDMWDMKPSAPTGIRGEFQPIATNVPGIEITEHLPQLARCADQYAIIRSLTHGDSSHGSASHTMLTGRRPRNLGEVPPREDDFPNFGAVLGKLRPTAPGTTPFVSYPWNISTSTNVVPGQNGGFLGQSFDPWRVEPSAAAATGPSAGTAANRPTFDVPLANLPDGVDPRRLQARRRLLDDLATSRASASFGELATIYERAFDLLLSPKFLEAFRVEREPEAVRERYGQNVFGQSLLLARRLVESGVRTTVVYWPDRSEPEAFNNNGVVDKVAVAAWDTHGHHVGNTPNFPRLKDHNLPPLDRGLTTFLADLGERGLLDETLVAVTGEFGRSPKINGDAGRDHYGNVFSAMLAGGGIKGGQTYGTSDKIGAFPADRPVTAGDFAATLYHALGVRPETEIRDRFDRPMRVADGGPVWDLFS